jgi:hypothetical protein
MPPREEDQDYFREDVRIRNVEVMLQRGDVDITAELSIRSAIVHPTIQATYILFHVFCSMLQCGLPNLEPHLGGWVIDESTICAKRIISSLLRLIWVSIPRLLLLRHRRRW